MLQYVSMADGLWLLTISYEPSAINYRLYIKIAFIRSRVNNVFYSPFQPASLASTHHIA